MILKRTILITGAGGRLGSALVNHLARTHRVVQFDLHEPADPRQRGLGPVFVGSITQPASLEPAFEGVDAVVHCAAIPGSLKPYDEVVAVNELGTFNVLEAAGTHSRVDLVVYISSICRYGLHEEPYDEHLPQRLPIDETHPSCPVDYYASSKAAAEFWCEKYVQRFRKPVVIVQPPLIIKTADEPDFKAAETPDHPHLNDYIGTSDLVDGIIRALDYHPQSGIDRFLFHAADQRSTTPSAELARRYYPGVPIDLEKLESCGGFGALVDCSHAYETLQWTPRFRCKR